MHITRDWAGGLLLTLALALGGCQALDRAVQDIQRTQTGATANDAVHTTNQNIVDGSRTVAGSQAAGNRSSAGGSGSDTTGAGQDGGGRKPGDGASKQPGPKGGQDTRLAERNAQELRDLRRTRREVTAPVSRPRTSADLTKIDAWIAHVQRTMQRYKDVETRWAQLLREQPNWNTSAAARRKREYKGQGRRAKQGREQVARSVASQAKRWYDESVRRTRELDGAKARPASMPPVVVHAQAAERVARGLALDTAASYARQVTAARAAVARASKLKPQATPRPPATPKAAPGDEQLVIAVSRDSWKVKRYRTTGDAVHTEFKSSKIQDIAMSADGKKVIILRDSWKIKTYDAAGQQLGEFKRNKAEAIACSADASRIIVKIDGWKIHTCDASGKKLAEFKVSKPGAIALSGDGKKVLVCVDSWKLYTYDAISGEKLHSFRVDKLQKVATNNDGSRIAVMVNNWKIRIYDATGKRLVEWKVNKPGDIAMTPDGKRVVVIQDAWRIKTFDAGTGEELNMFKVSKAQQVAVSGR